MIIYNFSGWQRRNCNLPESILLILIQVVFFTRSFKKSKLDRFFIPSILLLISFFFKPWFPLIFKHFVSFHFVLNFFSTMTWAYSHVLYRAPYDMIGSVPQTPTAVLSAFVPLGGPAAHALQQCVCTYVCMYILCICVCLLLESLFLFHLIHVAVLATGKHVWII